MGEIDMKPIESVQVALSLFEEKCDKKRYGSSSVNEMEKEKDLGSVLKDLANVKVQLEAKDSANKQAILKLDHRENMVDELCTLLMSSDLEKEIYMIECRRLRIHVLELELRMKEMDGQFLESIKIREQLSHAIGELRATQGELLIAERELVAARDAKLVALTHAEVIDTALNMEKFKTEELLRNVSKLNETVLHSRMTATEAEEKAARLHEREVELELIAANAREEVEFMTNQLGVMHDSDNKLLEKYALIDSMKTELQQVNDLHGSCEKVISDAVSEVKKLKEDLVLKERKNWDQSAYICLLESELKQIKAEFTKANEDSARLNADVEKMSIELEQIEKEMVESKEKESEAQAEIACLKSELHEERSNTEAPASADSIAKSEKSALHFALKQLACESCICVDNRNKTCIEHGDVLTFEEAKEESEDGKAYITIPREEYDQLLKKSEQVDEVTKPVHEEPNELALMRKELETTTVKIGEFRTRAEAAEKAKAAIEGQIKRWKEHKERRKAALAALREESVSKEIINDKPNTPHKTYQPLGKVLKMKF